MTRIALKNLLLNSFRSIGYRSRQNVLLRTRILKAVLWAHCLVFVVHSTIAFELSPIPTKAEIFRAKRDYGILFRVNYPVVEFGIHQFSTPVHEALTQLGYDCDDTIEHCADINLDFAGSGVLAGIRWNDDPPFQFKAGLGRYPGCPTTKEKSSTISFALRTNCWYAHFKG